MAGISIQENANGSTDALDDEPEALRRIFEADPPDLEGGLELAGKALGRGQAERALAIYERIITLSPVLSEAHFGRALVLRRQGRDSEAMDEFRVAFEGPRPHAEAGLGLADMLVDRGEIHGPLELYDRVLLLVPDLAEAHYGRGNVLRRLGRDVEAMEAFSLAFGSARPHPEAGLKLADIQLVRCDAASALATYVRLIDVAPHLAEAHYGRCISALQLGRLDDARSAVRRALELRPEFPAAIVVDAFLSSFPSEPRSTLAQRHRPLINVPILPFTRDWLGGQIYVLNLVRILSLLPKAQRPRIVVSVFLDDWHTVPTLRDTVEKLLECEAVVGAFDRRRQVVVSKPVLDRYARSHSPGAEESGDWTGKLFAQVDLVFPVLYPCWGAASVAHPVFWIPDIQHRFFPANFTPAEVSARDRDMAALSAREVPIVFSSRDAETHFMRFFPQQRCRTYVWHFRSLPDRPPSTADRDSAHYAALGLPKRFYYTANQFWPHKDHASLFRALRQILDAGRDVTFVCTGSDLTASPDAYSRELLDLIKELRLEGHLRLLGVLPRALQLEVMRRACAVIQPSLFEGWSTVVEDARMLGRPLIVSDIPVHREQVGADATLFRAGDPVSLAQAVTDLDRRLSPGPDLAREAAARRDAEARALQSGRDFLAIVRDECERRSLRVTASTHDASPPPSVVRHLVRKLPLPLRNSIHRLRAAIRSIRHPFRSRVAPDWLRPAAHGVVKWWRAIRQPQLFALAQYAPRPLRLPARYFRTVASDTALRIGIVTPSYNSAAYLQATIDSVICQGYPNLLYTVQDGGSTDATLDLLKSLGPAVTWRSERDKGQAHAINLGFARIDAEVMGYLNSDDILLPNSLAYVSQFFARRPDVDVIYGHRITIDEAGNEIGRWLLPSHDPEAIKWADFIPQETMFWRRRVWDAIGPFDESFTYALDWDFILRAEAAGFRLQRVPRFLAAFRVHAAQKTTSIAATGDGEMARLRRTHLGRIPDDAEIERAIRKYVRRHAVICHLHTLKLLRS